MLTKMGNFFYRRRIGALSVILILVIGAAIYGLGVFDFLNNGSTGVDNSSSSEAAQLYQTKFGNTSTDVLLLLRSKRFQVTDTAFTQAATALLSTLNTRPEVASLTSFLQARTLVPDRPMVTSSFAST
jgi:predicted RND superfamily exporter protein